MSDSTMVERVATLLANEYGDVRNVRRHMGPARRLLAALRDPTSQMDRRMPAGYRPGSHSTREIWNALIDGAIAEEDAS